MNVNFIVKVKIVPYVLSCMSLDKFYCMRWGLQICKTNVSGEGTKIMYIATSSYLERYAIHRRRCDG